MCLCHCGSGHTYADCCAPYILGEKIAPTAEALMRSRYSAYAERAIDYLGDTLHPDHRTDWDREATRRWADNATWQSLEVVSVDAGQARDDEGRIEFVATYQEGGLRRQHRELGRFERFAGRWYYVDGEVPKPKTRRHATPRVGRNAPCPCGSGKKYKKCCGR